MPTQNVNKKPSIMQSLSAKIKIIEIVLSALFLQTQVTTYSSVMNLTHWSSFGSNSYWCYAVHNTSTK